MKKTIKIFLILLVILFIPIIVQADSPQPHPDPYSGDLGNYEGKWIIDGKTEQDSNWTLEISDGKYHLHNEYQDFEGDVIFTPGQKDFGKPDTLWLDFDPSLKIEIVLENQDGGLIDVSGQGLIFVRPGNHVEFDVEEEVEIYSKEKMVGDWVLDKMLVIVPDYDFFRVELSNNDIMAGSTTGDTRLIISFGKDGVLYQVSEKLEIRAPITRYRVIGGKYIYFKNPNPITPYFSKFDANYIPENSGLDYAGQLVIYSYPSPEEPEVFTYMIFSRITSVEQLEGGS